MALPTSALSPCPKLHFEDENGAPLIGGLLWTYLTGTSTQAATYTDSDLSVPNTNPIVLDGRGECILYWAGTAYKFVLESPPEGVAEHGAEIWSRDPIFDAGMLIVSGLASGEQPIVYTQDGTGAVAQTVAEKLARWLDVVDFGADPTGSANANDAFQAAVDEATARGGATIWVPAGVYKFGDDPVLVGNDTEIRGTRGASILRGGSAAVTAIFINTAVSSLDAVEARPVGTSWKTGGNRNNDISFEGLTFDGAMMRAIVLAGVDRLSLRHCDFLGGSGLVRAVELAGAITDAMIDHNRVWQVAQGFWVRPGAIATSGVHPATETCARIRISQNTFEAPTLGALGEQILAHTFWGNIEDLDVVHNSVRTYSNSVPQTLISVGVDAAGDEANASLDGLLVTGNIVRSLNTVDAITGIKVFNEGAVGDEITAAAVYGNIIDGCATAGVVAPAGVAYHNWVGGLFRGRNEVRESYGTAAPTTGVWTVGAIVWNSAPALGGWAGWLCIVAGSPGTWAGFGRMEISSPSASPSASASKSPSVSPSATPSVSASVSESVSPSVSESASPSVSPSVSASISPSVSPSVSESVSPSVSASASPS